MSRDGLVLTYFCYGLYGLIFGLVQFNHLTGAVWLQFSLYGFVCFGSAV